MVADVHLEFLAQSAALPIREKISIVVKVRPAAQIDVAHQHSTKMAHMAHAIAGGSNRSEKLDSPHHDHKNSHGDRDRQRKQPDLPMRHHDRHCEQNAVDRPGSSNRGDAEQTMTRNAAHNQKCSHQHIDQAGADSANEVVGVKTPRAPRVLQISAEHREVKQIEKDVKEVAVKEEVCERLPDSPVKDNVAGSEAEPIEPKLLPRFVKKQR